MDNGSPGKKPPAPSVGRPQPEGMTLGNMHSLGPRSLDVTCKASGHRTIFNVDDWPDEVLVPSFGPRMRCEMRPPRRLIRLPTGFIRDQVESPHVA
jgi:hypothetical protein